MINSISPMNQEALVANLSGFLAVSLGINPDNEDEMTGTTAIAQSCIDFFKTSLGQVNERGAGAVLWILFSAIWEGKYSQVEINEFFSSVDFDYARLFEAWKKMKTVNDVKAFSTAVLPGNFKDSDIFTITKALFANQPKVNVENDNG